VSDGGFIIVGVTKSRGTGGEDVYLVRLEDDAKVVWGNGLWWYR